MAQPKNKTEFGAGTILVKESGTDYIVLVINRGLLDNSWRDVSAGLSSKWWVFSVPQVNVSVSNRVCSISAATGFGFDSEVEAIDKFNSLVNTEHEIGKIDIDVLGDNELT